MVKFSKQLEAQLIPEWKEAFVNYWKLKKNIKKIKLFRNEYIQQNNHHFGFSIFDPIRNVAKKISTIFSGNTQKQDKIQMIRNSTVSSLCNLKGIRERIQGSNSIVCEEARWGNAEDPYENDVLQLFSEEDEVKEFFERLDEELNKVNQFYLGKEMEFIERGEILNRQLEILIDLKQILHDRRKNLNGSSDLSRCNSSSNRRSNACETVTEIDVSLSASPAEEMIETFEKNGVNFIGSAGSKTNKGKPKLAMKIDIPTTTPTRAITAVTAMLWEDLINSSPKYGRNDYVSRKKIQCAEKMIRGAFIELYKGLGLLKTYRSLNMIAFTKILKKFDKVSNQQSSGTYLKAVKRSYFISSDKIVKLVDEVESIFIKNFAFNDRKKAMKFLRPQQPKESHMVTFLVGLFTGSFATLFSVYVILAHLSGMFSIIGENGGYMAEVYPIFSMFSLLSLHIFLYGCNLFMWKNTRINCNFIFEFSPRTALKYRDAFLICASFMTMVVAALVIHLLLRSHGFLPHFVDVIPGILLMVFTALLICPFNIFYRPTRYCFLRVMRNIICSPFYKVLMADFFMTDQLTSQIPLLRHMEFTLCYFLAGAFKTMEYETCATNKLYRELAYVISFLPYYWRAMQCARRWFDEGDMNHIANLGKYASAMLAAGARLTFAMQPSSFWLATVIITSSLATVFQLYWDFVKDWGLLNPKSKNPWLRDELILKNRSIYYVSIGLNFFLRLAWVETVMHFNMGKMEYRIIDFLLASLEIIRRGHWNFYRLENEHLNNIGNFRAVKVVPLPFRDEDSD